MHYQEIDKWYACFAVDYAPITTPIPENAVGIDVGINSFAVLSSDGKLRLGKFDLYIASQAIASRIVSVLPLHFSSVTRRNEIGGT